MPGIGTIGNLIAARGNRPQTGGSALSEWRWSIR